MRRLVPWLALLLAIAPALPALSQDDEDWEDWEEEEDEGGGGWSDYGSSVGNRFLIGVNSLMTWPADPVMGTVSPREEFGELPAASVSKRVVGLCQGTLLGGYRMGMGALDVVFSPMTPFLMLSPEPRYMIFPGVAHDEY
jgi:hypothetical protein